MKRLESVQIMRGIAATMVMVHHFTYANPIFAANFPVFTGLFKYCWLGVWMFFVISGFVIPYAMYSMNYRIGESAWPFFLRRIVRLEPAYIVSVFVAFALAFAAARTPGYGGPAEPSMRDFLLQFLYLCQWFHVHWLIDPAWTLAIEFQFYLFMLLTAPLLLSRSAPVKILFFAGVLAASLLVTDKRALFHYLPCFAIGFAVFLFYVNRIGVPILLALCGVCAAFTAFESGIPIAIAAIISAALIFVPIYRPLPLLSSLGTISYSLYLMHTLIGVRIVNLALRTSSPWIQLGGLAAAIAASLSAAAALWYFVERPSQLQARTIKGRSAIAATASILRRDEVHTSS
jgi:peptidoglycan/LPS O-acetylase OafA/YrhL